MYTSSRSFRVFESICQELIPRLHGHPSAEARAFTAQAHELLAIIDGWRQHLPTQEQRSAVIARVLDLHRAAMEYLTLANAKHPHE